MIVVMKMYWGNSALSGYSLSGFLCWRSFLCSLPPSPPPLWYDCVWATGVYEQVWHSHPACWLLPAFCHQMCLRTGSHQFVAALCLLLLIRFVVSSRSLCLWCCSLSRAAISSPLSIAVLICFAPPLDHTTGAIFPHWFTLSSGENPLSGFLFVINKSHGPVLCISVCI